MFLLRLPYRILNINHKKEPLRSLWVESLYPDCRVCAMCLGIFCVSSVFIRVFRFQVLNGVLPDLGFVFLFVCLFSDFRVRRLRCLRVFFRVFRVLLKA